MIYKAFSVLDVKSEVYSKPFFMLAVGEAVRAFKDLVNDQATTVSRHPDDFKLVQLGTFDDIRGELLYADPVSLGFASEYKAMGSVVPLGVNKEVSHG